MTPDDIPERTARMIEAAENLRFEDAARLRDQIKALEAGEPVHGKAGSSPRKPQKKARYRRK